MKRISLLILTVLIILNAHVRAQEIPIWKKMHYLSEEEMKLPNINAKNFIPTDPPIHPVRMIGEYEQMQSVLVRYPFGLPVSLIAEMSQDCQVTTIVANSSQQSTVTSTYQSNGANMANIDFILAPSNSYWTRDYGPWFVIDGNEEFGVCDFPYNRPRPDDNDIPSEVADYLGINLFGMDLEGAGGNWMCTGIEQAASTDLIWEENTNMSHTEIAEMVDDYLGVSEYHVLLDPLGDYIKHIDCWGKFLGENKVLIGSVLPSDNRYEDFEYVADYFASTISDWGMPYEVYRVYTPGYSPNTPYTNSLILNKRVFVPITGSTHDAQAITAYEEAMPGYEIIGVMYGGWENTDALHCRTKGIADIGMLKIKHMPLSGDVPLQDEYEITASITAYSAANIYPDSVRLYYKSNGGAYQFVTMTLQSGNLYTGMIPYQEHGTVVNYYIHAADESGRSANHPFIGAPDPHQFTVIQTTPYLTVAPTNKNVSSMAGSFEVTVSSNVNWSVSDTCSWVSCTPTIGSNDGTFTVNYTENTSWEPRTCIINVEGDGETATVTLIQAAAVPYLTLTPTNNNVSSSAGSFPVSVGSNVNWTVSDTCSWVSCSPTSGSNNGTFTISYDENTSATRICIIDIAGEGESATFTLIQEGLLPIPGLIVTPDTLLYTDVQQAFEGEQVRIYPDGDEDVIIDHINMEGVNSFYWYAEPLVTFPYNLLGGDSLILTVYIAIPVDNTVDFVQDTMFIQSEGGDHEVLIMVDEDIISDISEVQDPIQLGGVYPNPFDDRINIKFNLLDDQHVQIDILDIRGSLMKTIADKQYFRGEHQLRWDGTNHHGQDCPSGIYHVIISSDNFITSTKVIKK